MTTAVQNLLRSFDRLSEPEKQEAMAAILRRSLALDFPPLSEEELILSAEELFLELDRQEAQDA
jgi:hypothetical protein